MISYTYTKETRKTKRGTLASKMFKKKKTISLIIKNNCDSILNFLKR